MKEAWKDIEGCGGSYRISNLGRVKTLPRVVYRGNFMSRQIIKEKILTPEITNRGYYRITFQKNKIKVHISVHRLVGLHFVTNPENKPQINHKDGNKANNYYKNLEWCTSMENVQHSYDTGLNVAKKGFDNPKSMPVLRLSEDGELQNYGSLCELSRIENVSRTSVSRAIKANRKYKGYYYVFA